MKIRNRKALFLHSTILRGRLFKDGNEDGGATGGGDDTEVGPGFAEAADRLAGDDTRRDGEKRMVEVDEDANTIPAKGKKGAADPGDNADGADDDDGGDGGDDDGDGEGDDEGKNRPKKRNTAEVIRDLKRERKDARAREAALEARLAALEKGDLPNRTGADTNNATSGKPDANDATKYPLGVLDDGYINDMIEWTADRKVRETLDGERKTEQAREAQAQAETHVTELRTKVDDLTAKGSELFDDYEETVTESAMRGDWQLSETTFTAAAEADHGPEILYGLATDKAEAARVAKLSPFKQLQYVQEKDAEIATKRSARRKPQAGDPPSNLPRGRNSSSPIRADTDNLDDFRKIFYKK